MADPIRTNKAEEEAEVPYDTSDPQVVNTVRKKAARTRADRLEFVKAAMQHEQGRAWFYDLLVRCYITRTPFISGDPHATSFRCGEQNIGLQIIDDIQTASPDEYTIMMTEGKKR